MPDPVAPLREGLADRYAFERELGRGGMATVWLARDLRHDRPVALKVLHPELAASLGPERFQREIRLAARLQHPHILTVLDSGAVTQAEKSSPDRLWFTMPYVEGESLRDRLRRERQLPVDDALRIARESAQALQYAHGHGVVHRDIKPENLLLTADGNTLVADFGIARALTGDAGDNEKLTETGLSVGTPAYMSPEQAAGDRALDARTDVYSLAAVLYEMLAGEPPFSGATVQSLMMKRLTEPAPSVRSTRPSVPESVDQAIRKALAPAPADRYTTMAQFAGAIATGTTGTGIASGTTAAADATRVVAATPGAAAKRRFPLAAAALVLGLLIGGGALFAWRRSHPDADGAGGPERRIAVLPFQNVGDSADAYFADGITDAVRGKLTALPTMRVTASNSSAEYRGSTKSPQEIGRELGVDYLLVGRVRWQKGAGGTSRVQVSPELIEVATADAKWQQPFDASLTDVFQVQADIAGRVAQALDVAIGTRQKEAIETRPTQNLAAYDAYLKGEAARRAGVDPRTLRQAIAFYEEAVALDSAFAAAWASLGVSNSVMYQNGSPSVVTAERARTAAERALALDPRSPAGYWALGGYYRLVTFDLKRAIETYAKGLAFAPADAELLRGLGSGEAALGHWEDGVQHLQRSLSLDPRNPTIATGLGDALFWLRRYDEAMATVDAALAIDPGRLDPLQTKAMIHIARGDLEGARRIFSEPPQGVDLPGFVAYMGLYWDTYFALSDAQRALLKRLTPAAFDGDAGLWGLTLAGVYEMEKDPRRVAAYADSARIAFEQQLTATPDDAQRRVVHGVALAYLGRKAEAIREGQRGVELVPVASNAQSGAYYQHQLARIYILVGEPDRAIDLLEQLLKRPYYLSPGWLRVDPTFDPIRTHPRFKRLAELSP